jgi:UDP-glucose 4-epimerase
MKDQPPTLYGDGSQSRDFTFIKDVIQANIKAAVSKKCDGLICNVATGKRITVEELATKIIDFLDKDIKPVCVPPKAGDVKHSLADISRARELMGYEPNYNIDTGLAETIPHFLNKEEL